MRMALWALSLLLSLAVQAQNVILIAAADAYPPYVDPERPGDGLAMEIVRAAFALQGFDVKLEMVPWARAEQGVTEGRYDILVDVWRTEAREKVMLFSTPYAVSKIKFIKLKGDPFEFTGLSSLDGKRIGAIRGYGYGEAFENPTQFVREDTSSLKSNLQKLVLKRIDLTLEDEITAKAVIEQQLPEYKSMLDFSNASLSNNPLYVSAGIKNPKHKAIIEAFDKGFEAIKLNGTLKKIYKKYGLTY